MADSTSQSPTVALVILSLLLMSFLVSLGMLLSIHLKRLLVIAGVAHLVTTNSQRARPPLLPSLSSQVPASSRVAASSTETFPVRRGSHLFKTDQAQASENGQELRVITALCLADQIVVLAAGSLIVWLSSSASRRNLATADMSWFPRMPFDHSLTAALLTLAVSVRPMLVAFISLGTALKVAFNVNVEAISTLRTVNWIQLIGLACLFTLPLPATMALISCSSRPRAASIILAVLLCLFSMVSVSTLVSLLCLVWAFRRLVAAEKLAAELNGVSLKLSRPGEELVAPTESLYALKVPGSVTSAASRPPDHVLDDTQHSSHLVDATTSALPSSMDPYQTANSLSQQAASFSQSVPRHRKNVSSVADQDFTGKKQSGWKEEAQSDASFFEADRAELDTMPVGMAITSDRPVGGEAQSQRSQSAQSQHGALPHGLDPHTPRDSATARMSPRSPMPVQSSELVDWPMDTRGGAFGVISALGAGRAFLSARRRMTDNATDISSWQGRHHHEELLRLELSSHEKSIAATIHIIALIVSSCCHTGLILPFLLRASSDTSHGDNVAALLLLAGLIVQAPIMSLQLGLTRSSQSTLQHEGLQVNRPTSRAFSQAPAEEHSLSDHHNHAPGHVSFSPKPLLLDPSRPGTPASTKTHFSVKSVPYAREHWTAGKVVRDAVLAPRSAVRRGFSLAFEVRPRLDILSQMEDLPPRSASAPDLLQPTEGVRSSSSSTAAELSQDWVFTSNTTEAGFAYPYTMDSDLSSPGRARHVEDYSSASAPLTPHLPGAWRTPWSRHRASQSGDPAHTRDFQLDGLSALILPQIAPGISLGSDIAISVNSLHQELQYAQEFSDYTRRLGSEGATTPESGWRSFREDRDRVLRQQSATFAIPLNLPDAVEGAERDSVLSLRHRSSNQSPTSTPSGPQPSVSQSQSANDSTPTSGTFQFYASNLMAGSPHGHRRSARESFLDQIVGLISSADASPDGKVAGSAVGDREVRPLSMFSSAAVGDHYENNIVAKTAEQEPKPDESLPSPFLKTMTIGGFKGSQKTPTGSLIMSMAAAGLATSGLASPSLTDTRRSLGSSLGLPDQSDASRPRSLVDGQKPSPTSSRVVSQSASKHDSRPVSGYRRSLGSELGLAESPDADESVGVGRGQGSSKRITAETDATDSSLSTEFVVSPDGTLEINSTPSSSSVRQPGQVQDSSPSIRAIVSSSTPWDEDQAEDEVVEQLTSSVSPEQTLDLRQMNAFDLHLYKWPKDEVMPTLYEVSEEATSSSEQSHVIRSVGQLIRCSPAQAGSSRQVEVSGDTDRDSASEIQEIIRFASPDDTLHPRSPASSTRSFGWAEIIHQERFATLAKLLALASTSPQRSGTGRQSTARMTAIIIAHGTPQRRSGVENGLATSPLNWSRRSPVEEPQTPARNGSDVGESFGLEVVSLLDSAQRRSAERIRNTPHAPKRASTAQSRSRRSVSALMGIVRRIPSGNREQRKFSIEESEGTSSPDVLPDVSSSVPLQDGVQTPAEASLSQQTTTSSPDWLMINGRPELGDSAYLEAELAEMLGSHSSRSAQTAVDTVTSKSSGEPPRAIDKVADMSSVLKEQSEATQIDKPAYLSNVSEGLEDASIRTKIRHFEKVSRIDEGKHSSSRQVSASSSSSQTLGQESRRTVSGETLATMSSGTSPATATRNPAAVYTAPLVSPRSRPLPPLPLTSHSRPSSSASQFLAPMAPCSPGCWPDDTPARVKRLSQMPEVAGAIEQLLFEEYNEAQGPLKSSSVPLPVGGRNDDENKEPGGDAWASPSPRGMLRKAARGPRPMPKAQVLRPSRFI